MGFIPEIPCSKHTNIPKSKNIPKPKLVLFQDLSKTVFKSTTMTIEIKARFLTSELCLEKVYFQIFRQTTFFHLVH